MPAACASAVFFPSSSKTTTSAPPSFKARAASRPELPRPKTATFFPAKVVMGIIKWFCRPGPAKRPGSLSIAMPSYESRFGRTTASQSSQLQRRKACERQHHGNDPKADHDLRFGPAELLVVVMNGRHLEHALAGELERNDLDDHRNRFQHEQAADNSKHDFVLDRDSDCAQQPAQRASRCRP